MSSPSADRSSSTVAAEIGNAKLSVEQANWTPTSPRSANASLAGPPSTQPAGASEQDGHEAQAPTLAPVQAPSLAPASFEVPAQPVSAGMGSQGTPTPPGVDMQAMVEELHASIELATGQGATQARIALRPAELGGIRIHLSQTESGLLVRLTPDSSAGAQALGEAHSELHRSLSSLGVPLLRMDIGSQAQSDARPREDRLAGDGQSSGHGAGAGADTEGEPEPQLLGAEHPVTTLRTLDGRLVDVLA